MTTDAITAYKLQQKENWATFMPIEIFTALAAPALVKFSQLNAGHRVLDVSCGTGVVAITAARVGAKASGIDLCPALIEHGQANVQLAGLDIDLREGDVEELPYADHAFDVVLSQFGHMFSPRPSIAIKEMLRVLKPGGTIAFSTWPPDLYVGRLFNLVAKYSPPVADVPPVSYWGDPSYVREQLGDAVEGLTFGQEMMRFPALSIGHYCQSIEKTVGPIIKLIKESKQDMTHVNQFRSELRDLASAYYDDNYMHQHYLMSRARKK
jgi:ubiquinone/menaquinone biosynthesis C-methylase UbiE